MFKIIFNIKKEDKESLDNISILLEKFKNDNIKIESTINFTNEIRVILKNNTNILISWINKIPTYQEVIKSLKYYKNRGS